MIMMTIPFLLLFRYTAQRKRVVQSFLSGDNMHYTKFDVPYYRVVAKNDGWEKHSLMLPHVEGYSARSEDCKSDEFGHWQTHHFRNPRTLPGFDPEMEYG